MKEHNEEHMSHERNPKIQPEAGDVIRWTTTNDAGTFVTLVTSRLGQRVYYVDVSPNGYPDHESAHLNEWLAHSGIQNGDVLFAASKF